MQGGQVRFVAESGVVVDRLVHRDGKVDGQCDAVVFVLDQQCQSGRLAWPVCGADPSEVGWAHRQVLPEVPTVHRRLTRFA